MSIGEYGFAYMTNNRNNQSSCHFIYIYIYISIYTSENLYTTVLGKIVYIVFVSTGFELTPDALVLNTNRLALHTELYTN